MEPRRGVSLPSEQVGPYRLQEPLGRGGMGTVWRAWDDRLKRQVAIKQIRADAAVSHIRTRLRREARAAARLNHPAIVHIYDIVEGDDGDWIVMELVSGRTLRQLLDEQGPLPPATAARLGSEIAEGLAEAHEYGILHRDLKTGNVMVTPAGRAKILDFGLAKDLAHEGVDQEPTLSVPGIVLGTAHAMSPEQALGRDLDARSDLFSLGGLLYETVTGYPPFRGDSYTSSLARVLSFQPRPLRQVVSGLPAELSDLVDRLLEKEPHNRPGSAREVASTLAALAPSLAATAGAHVLPPADDPTLPWAPLQKPPQEETPLRASAESGRRRMFGERLFLTVVCCGLVELAEDSGEAGFLDLEILSEIMAAFQELAGEVGGRHSGHLGTALGHLLWLYFGYPQAHEDDVLRAVRTAQELAARIGEIGARLGPRGKRWLGLRIAVHTGPAAVVSLAGQEEKLQLGSVLDLATGLQSAAPIGEVVLSGASQKLIARDFSTEALPPVQVPGVGEPIAVHRVLGEIDPWERGSGASTPLVGREREIGLLEDWFRLTCSGAGQAVMIVGEAGIGKSRLVKALRERLVASGAAWWIAYGSPATQNSPLAPLIDLLDRTVSGSGEISPGGKLGQLAKLLEGSPVPESLSLLAYLLALRPEEIHPPLDLSPEAQRKRTFEALLALVTEMAERQPLVLVIEDLHWADPSTLELLGLLLDEMSTLPLMLIATYRPDLQAPWGHRSHVAQLRLNRLTQDQATALVDRLAGETGVPAEIRQQILARTEGVPLFVEELTMAVLESGRTGDPPTIPDTLHGSLAARLDRLGMAKEVAQVASVIGRTFSFDLLEAVAPFDAETLQQGMDELIQAELVHRRGVGARARYSFKHILIQDAAYLSLLGRDRLDLHLKIARTLEARLPEGGAAPSGTALQREGGEAGLLLLAHHWSKAVDSRHPDPEVSRKAVAYLIAAGEHALELSAYPEASSHFAASFDILRVLPEEPDRDRQELRVQTRLSTILKVVRGWDSPEVKAAYDRARELCLRLDDRRELLQILFGLWSYHLFHVAYESSLHLAEEFLAAARQAEVFDLLMAHCAMSNSLFWLARLPEALYHAEEVIRLSAAEHHEAYRIRYGQDPRVHAGQLAVYALWHLGGEEEALARHESMLQLAETLAHPFTLAIALSTSVLLHKDRNDADAVLPPAEALIALSREKGFLIYEMVGAIFRTWVMAQKKIGSGWVEEASGLVEAPGRLGLACRCGMLAEICLQAGSSEAALEAISRGLEVVAHNGELAYEANLYCLQAEALLARASGPDAAEAEACLQRAFDLACRRWQVPFAERAALLLGRLRGEREAAELAERLCHLRVEAAERVREALSGALAESPRQDSV